MWDRMPGLREWRWEWSERAEGRQVVEGGEEGGWGETSRRLETGELRACLQRDPVLAEAPRLAGTFTADGFSSVGSCGEDETGGGAGA